MVSPGMCLLYIFVRNEPAPAQFYDMLADWLDFPETEYIIKTGQSNHDYWAGGKGTAVFQKLATRAF